MADDARVQVAVDRERQRTRDGRRRHDEQVRAGALRAQGVALAHAKAMLLIGDHKAKILVHHFFLDQGVSSNDHICLPGCDFSINSSFLFLGG